MADYYHGGRAMYSNTDECYDAGRHGGSVRAYSRTDEYYDNVDDRMRRPAYGADDCGYGGRQTAVYADEYSRGGRYEGYGVEQEHFKREEKEHKHKIEAGVATAAALGAGGYAYHEHREQKEAHYESRQQEHRVPHGHGHGHGYSYYCD
uniref:Uncharacterized protein n=1 Tax=Zea mays TaxID=4577 RepID=A0A804QY46_MAIZE